MRTLKIYGQKQETAIPDTLYITISGATSVSDGTYAAEWDGVSDCQWIVSPPPPGGSLNILYIFGEWSIDANVEDLWTKAGDCTPEGGTYNLIGGQGTVSVSL